MKKLLQFKNIFAIIAGLMFSIILVCLFISVNNYSLAGTVSMEGNAGVIMYVNGEYVEYVKATNSYRVTQDCDVTITIINDNKIANNEDGKPIMTIKRNGANFNTSQQQIYTFKAEVGQNYTVSINSSAIQKDQTGLSLSDPFIISNYQELETLDAILRDKTLTDLQKTYHEKTFLYKDKNFLRTAYYRLDDNFIFVGDENYSYYGLVNFSGVFDFNNFTLTVKLENNNPTFASETNVGLFANLVSDTVGDKIYPCVIRNGLVRGSLSLIAPNSGSSSNTLNIGGIAGKAANNIIVDNVISSMSVTAETNTNINIGGYFGYSEYSLNDQNKLKYDGIYTSSKAITNGANASINSGALFGVLRNSYINSLDIQMSNVNVIGISTNASSGTINSGGLIGLYEHASSSYNELNIKNIKINATDAIEVSAEINNSANNSEETKESNAGGVIGKVNANKPIYFYDVSFITSDILQPAEIYVSSINRAKSKGDVYAGGLIGQIPDSNCYYGMTGDTTLNIFDCDLDVQAIQNGYSEAYASAMFGYNSLVKDNNYNLKINLNNENRSLNVLAQQSSLSRNLYTSNEDSSLRKVAAGYVSSYLQSNYKLNNFELTLNNGKVTAERAVGSTIYGPLYAGGYAGYASCSSNSSNYTFANIKMNYNNSSIYGLSSSFDSNKNGNNMYYKEDGRNKPGNASNTCVGGFIGYMVNYGTVTINNSRGSFSGTNKPGIDDLTITFNNTETNDGVIGVHNAFSDSTADYVVQGYVGGVVGLVNNGTFRNLNVNSTSNKTKIYLEASSNPNTANCGGLIGTNFKGANFYLINGSVSNLDVTLNAYSSLTNNQYYFDAFCGGVIGSLSKDGGSLNPEVSNVIVKDTDVNCIGEDAMFTFAGGVVGGMWWGSAQYITNCSYINGNVHASSMSGMSYAGGIAGQGGPAATISSSYVVNSNVYCFNGSNNQSGAGGIVGYTRNGDGAVTYTNNYSNAYVYAEGSNSSIGGIYANGGASNNSKPNYFDPFNVAGFTSGSTYTNSDNGDGSNNSRTRAVALSIRSGTDNRNQHYNYYEVTPTNTRITVYPKYTFNDSSVLKIDYSGDTDCINANNNNNTINAVNNKIGVVYANLYITIAGEKYLFMSYPIYIDTRNNNNNSYNKYSYNSSITDNLEDYKWSMLSGEVIYYRQVNVTSNPETIEIGLAYDNSFPEYVLYSATEGTDGPTLVENKEKVYINSFNNKLDIEVTDKLISVTPYNDLAKRTVFIMALPNTYGQSSTQYTYLVLDYIPNYVTSLDVRLSEDTPSLGEESGSYIFSRNDTINLDTYEIYADSTSASSNYITYSAMDDLPTGVELKPNGTITIANNATLNQKFTINATYGGNRYNGSGKLTGTISLIIKQSYTYSTELTGSTFESHRKVVNGTPFDFVISPTIGYGLDPNRVIIEIGNKTYTLQNLNVQPKITTLNDSVNENLSGTITIDGAAFEYVYDPLKDSYSFIVPGGIVNNDIKIIVEYSLVSSIVIDRGIIYEVAGNERYYIYTIKDGTKLTNELFAPIKDEISLERYGYNFQSYYLTDNGTSVDSYGMTLGDLIKQGFTMHGPLYLYARWTYQVIVEYPDEVTVESTLPLTMLEKVDVDGVVHLIPINTTTPFTFKINTNEAFEGTPDFVVYTIDRKLVGGEYQYIHTEITQYCYKNSSGAYEIDPYKINGIIYIKVFNESIGFNDGETEIDSSLDTTITNDSIFTINYAVNYSSEGVVLEHTVAGHKGISIDFYNANNSELNILPAGTIIRLYRHINGKAYDSYYYVLQYDTSVLELDKFINMATGNTFANTNVTASTIRSENYYLVVTLPNHTTTYKTLSNNIIRFNVTYDESHVNVTKYGIDPGDEPPLPSGFIITRTYDVLPSIPVKVTRNGNTLTLDLGSTYYVEVAQSNNLSFEGKSYYWRLDSTNTLTDAQLSLFDTYFENRLMLTNANKTAYYTASKTLFEGDLPDGVTLTLLQAENDLRHQSKSYVWEVTANKDISSIVSTADDIFGESDKILTTLNSVYYLSKNGNYNVEALISEGYTVRLLEVLNTHSPASGIVVFTTQN